MPPIFKERRIKKIGKILSENVLRIESTRLSISGQRLSVVNIDFRRCKRPTVQSILKSLKRVSVTNGVFIAIVKFYGGYYRIIGLLMAPL